MYCRSSQSFRVQEKKGDMNNSQMDAGREVWNLGQRAANVMRTYADPRS